MPDLIIYTDGCCSKGGIGGSAFVAHDVEDNILYVWAEHQATGTTQTAELRAALAALHFANWRLHVTAGQRTVRVWSDSQYVVNGMSKWITGWHLNDWKTAAGPPVKNQDLWKTAHAYPFLLATEWNWVKGHSGVAGNELCDWLADVAKKKLFGGAGEAVNAHVWLKLHGLAEHFENYVHYIPANGVFGDQAG